MRFSPLTGSSFNTGVNLPGWFQSLAGGEDGAAHMFKMAKTGNSSWWSRARARANF